MRMMLHQFEATDKRHDETSDSASVSSSDLLIDQKGASLGNSTPVPVADVSHPSLTSFATTFTIIKTGEHRSPTESEDQTPAQLHRSEAAPALSIARSDGSSEAQATSCASSGDSPSETAVESLLQSVRRQIFSRARRLGMGKGRKCTIFICTISTLAGLELCCSEGYATHNGGAVRYIPAEAPIRMAGDAF